MSDKWFKNGLYFKCQQCSDCCTGAPGYVWLTEKDIQNIIKFLNIEEKDFLKKYTRHVRGQISLKELFPNYDCIFLKDRKCQIYQARPMQCKLFPWWLSNLNSKKAWESAKKICKGIDSEDAKHFSYEEIKDFLEKAKEIPI